MSYKNDHLLVISNKYGKAAGDAKVELFETYDRIRDLTVSGPQLGGGGFGATGSFLVNLSRLLAPSAFMPLLGNESINIPGTSFYSPVSGGNSILPGGTNSFGYGDLGKYPGFPSGGAAGIGSMYAPASGIGGVMTGGAAGIVGTVPNAVSATAGTASGFSWGKNIILPTAGVVAGIGGLLTSLSPYMGSSGTGANVFGNLLQGTSSAVAASYQNVSGRILNNADTILANKVKNIETTVKMLNTQSDVIKKMLKESMDGDSKAIQNL